MAEILFSIDRVENGTAILIARDDPAIQITLPVAWLPPGCGEGDIMSMSLERDEEATAAAKQRIALLIDKLRQKPT
jgi:hypothetical protein